MSDVCSCESSLHGDCGEPLELEPSVSCEDHAGICCDCAEYC